MSFRLKDKSKKLPKVCDTGQHQSRIEPEVVVKGLGAEMTGTTISVRTSPPSLFALREELARRLISTGGRKRLEGTTRRQKIPLQDDDWERLKELAKQVENNDIHPTAGQVASVLLRQVLQTINVAELKAMEH